MRRHAFVFVLCVIIVVLRRPDAIFHAQFWAEDGKTWYADAYHLGIQSLWHPATGNVELLPRFVAWVAQILPFSTAPLFFNCMGIIIQILPALFLMSPRCRKLGSVEMRGLLAFIYLALPNTYEMYINIANAQWRLAFMVLLVLFAEPDDKAIWKSFDYLILVFGALTGPFIILAVPVAVLMYFTNPRSQRRLEACLISVAGAVIQMLVLFETAGVDRPVHAARDASLQMLIRLLAKQVFLAPLLGWRTIGKYSLESKWGFRVAIAAAFLGIAIELFVFLKSSRYLKLFLVFAAGILAVSLANPTTAPPQWPNLLEAGGIRYWFFPMLAFVACIVWFLKSSNAVWLRGTGGLMLLIMLFGLIQDWGNPRPEDFRFQDYARQFEDAPSGTSVVIPLNPEGWSMELMKR